MSEFQITSDPTKKTAAGLYRSRGKRSFPRTSTFPRRVKRPIFFFSAMSRKNPCKFHQRPDIAITVWLRGSATTRLANPPSAVFPRAKPAACSTVKPSREFVTLLPKIHRHWHIRRTAKLTSLPVQSSHVNRFARVSSRIQRPAGNRALHRSGVPPRRCHRIHPLDQIALASRCRSNSVSSSVLAGFVSPALGVWRTFVETVLPPPTRMCTRGCAIFSSSQRPLAVPKTNEIIRPARRSLRA